jgi:hypothetical protein
LYKIRSDKTDPNRVRTAIDRHRIKYPGDIITTTAALLVKFMINSTLSIKGAKCFTMYISHFYLSTHLERKEHIRMKLANLYQSVVDRYLLKEFAFKGSFVFVAVKQGLYGLPQLGMLTLCIICIKPLSNTRLVN